MLSAVRISRSLAFRGVSTTASKKDIINYPASWAPNRQDRVDYQHHPNKNHSYYEAYHVPIPEVPRYGDKDEKLNALREKARTQHWSTISVEETNELYDNHYKWKYYRHTQSSDIWKFYLGCMMGMWGIAACMYRTNRSIQGLKNPEYLNDPKFLEEYVKRALQLNQGCLIGGATKWDYGKGEWRKEQRWWDGITNYFFPYYTQDKSNYLGFKQD